ncbi:hypothetical protein GJ496_009514 [Pomphorhynchus laevis]|nr:hypothetical protein GJ496_009514 [Pomphorhynchus laevis]
MDTLFTIERVKEIIDEIHLKVSNILNYNYDQSIGSNQTSILNDQYKSIVTHSNDVRRQYFKFSAEIRRCGSFGKYLFLSVPLSVSSNSNDTSEQNDIVYMLKYNISVLAIQLATCTYERFLLHELPIEKSLHTNLYALLFVIRTELGSLAKQIRSRISPQESDLVSKRLAILFKAGNVEKFDILPTNGFGDYDLSTLNDKDIIDNTSCKDFNSVTESGYKTEAGDYRNHQSMDYFGVQSKVKSKINNDECYSNITYAENKKERDLQDKNLTPNVQSIDLKLPIYQEYVKVIVLIAIIIIWIYITVKFSILTSGDDRKHL